MIAEVRRVANTALDRDNDAGWPTHPIDSSRKDSLMYSSAIRSLLAVVVLGGLVENGHAGRSNSLIDISPDSTRLLVANADNGSVSVVDLKERKLLREIKVGDKPEGVAWIGKGPLAAVTVYREDLVVFVDTEKGQVVRKLAVADEPY